MYVYIHIYIYIHVHTYITYHSEPSNFCETSGDAAAERRGHHVEVEAKLPKPPWQETCETAGWGVSPWLYRPL